MSAQYGYLCQFFFLFIFTSSYILNIGIPSYISSSPLRNKHLYYIVWGGINLYTYKYYTTSKMQIKCECQIIYTNLIPFSHKEHRIQHELYLHLLFIVIRAQAFISFYVYTLFQINFHDERFSSKTDMTLKENTQPDTHTQTIHSTNFVQRKNKGKRKYNFHFINACTTTHF